jgi:glucose-6-phosphate 1-dehydrogenase
MTLAADTQLAPQARTADPCVVVIFGASGDLTRRKLIPALINLQRGGFLPANFAVVGVARTPMSDAEFRKEVAPKGEDANDEKTRAAWAALAERVFYHAADATKPEAMVGLKEFLGQINERTGSPANYLFYLSVAPSIFAPTMGSLSRAGLADESGGCWRRVVIEKPFGEDLPSAIALNETLKSMVSERQIFRIDHYLGKETVQNLMVFRFGNGMFEPIWNRNYIDHVQITVAEELGVGSRAAYYDTAGAMRDMVPNHMAQLLSLVGMEPPMSFAADTVRDEQVKLLKSIQSMTHQQVLEDAVRGQYGRGHVDGKPVPGYRQEPKMPAGTTTETYVALRLVVENWRWAGVPFYVRTGKRLPKRTTQIMIQFKHAPAKLFQHTSVDRLTTNRLYIHIAPKEGISLRFGAKVPGPTLHVGAVEMDFDYVDYFGSNPSTGYETLLYDVMIGDATLFQRADMVEAGWSMVQPILDIWKALPPRNFPNYEAGSWGPPEADALLARDGRHWENS